MIQLDIIGTLYADAPEGYQPDALPGYNVNATHPVSGWEAQRVTPATPRRIFGGIPTVFYTFDDKESFDAFLEAADLTVIPLTPQSPEQVQTAIVAAVQTRLDAFARTRNYDSILSACTYANSTVGFFAIEGQFCVAARDETWATLYVYLQDVQAGIKPVPTGYGDVEPLLPVLEWPN